MEKEMKTTSNINTYILRSAVWTGLLSFGFVTLALAVNSPNEWHQPAQAAVGYNRTAKIPVQTRVLSFAERVAYQRIIEDIYWRHRIWPRNSGENPNPKPSLDMVMSQAQLESKVTDYLRKSQALENGQQRITADQLQAETDRMAQHTKQPEVLRELFAALGNDPLVIAECLARPLLAERLLTQSPNEQVKQTSGTYEQVAAASGTYRLPSISDDGGCTDDTWTATSTADAPVGREGHTAVWTGSEMIVWGGLGRLVGYSNTGGIYNPSTDSWMATSLTNAPTARDGHTAVWTGSEMIVWGGEFYDTSLHYLNTGGRYNPSTDSWTASTTTNTPEARAYHTAVWTGSEMIVWGGVFGNPNPPFVTNTGGRYNPSTDTWTVTSTTNAPSARDFHTAVWIGSEMIVWGGFVGGYDNTGGRYNPSTDSWTATSRTKAPLVFDHTAVWTGSEMIIWGRNLAGSIGGRYNPETDSWAATDAVNAPTPRLGHTAIWTGSEMIVWGGSRTSDYRYLKSGGRYDPVNDSWTATSTANAPTARYRHTAVWTGTEMIVWGGVSGITRLNTGGRYCAPILPPQLGNISTRAFVQTGDDVMIGGFMVQGTDPKRVIIRAIGPELTRYGVPNALVDPILELHDSSGALIASNDNWRSTIIGGIITTDQVTDLRNSRHAPSDGRESAMIAELPAGNYTAIVRGVNNTMGVGLVEVYDLSPEINSILGNISTRSFVQTGDNVMIGGFIVQGVSQKRVIIRAIGPDLARYGVPTPLADPTLELYDANGDLIASNDNWQHTIIDGIITSDQRLDILRSGHAPGNLLESAIIATLAPGNYTAIVRGVNNTTGIALVEVYDLD
jgi:N-acetylneuraminic acid mutarotase